MIKKKKSDSCQSNCSLCRKREAENGWLYFCHITEKQHMSEPWLTVALIPCPLLKDGGQNQSFNHNKRGLYSLVREDTNAAMCPLKLLIG